MKVVMEDDLIILYLNKFLFKSIDFSDKEVLQKYIKGLLLKLQDNYSLEFKGYYDITLYVDRNYGVIIEICREELEYLDYFGEGIEINTRIIEDSFLYEVNDIDFSSCMVYILGSNVYIRPKDSISNVSMGKIMEKTSRIIYGARRKEIVKRAKIVR